MFIKQKQTKILSLLACAFTAFVFVTALVSPLKAGAATYYFTGAGADTDWSNAANWCDDMYCESASGVVPSSSDDVFIYNQITSNSGGPAEVNTLVLDNTGSPNYIDNITVTVANGAEIRNNSYLASAGFMNGTITFKGSSHNDGFITGTAIFTEYSVNSSSAVITGNAEFRENASNQGVITGVVDVYYPSANPIGGDVGGATVNYIDYPRNLKFDGASTGNEQDWGDLANWYDEDLADRALSLPGQNDNIVIAYYSNGVTTNSLGVTPEVANLTVQDNGPGSVVFGIDINVSNEVIFSGAAFQSGGSTITASAITFTDSSYFEGTLNGNVYIGATAYWAGGSPGSQGVYHVDVNNWKGTVNGSLYFGIVDPVNLMVFGGSTVNEGYIPASTAVQFDSTSHNAGVVAGNAYFDTSYYHQMYSHPEDVFLINDRVWSGSVGGVVYKGTYDLPVTVNSFHFIGNSVNAGTINKDVVFEEIATGYNQGVINGNAIFNGPSYNNGGTINGDVTFNDSSYNDGSITGNATFNGDYSEFQSGTISGTKTRYYTTSATTTRSFISNGPWTVVADGSDVVVDVGGADYDGDTVFTPLNGGAFSGYVPPSRNLTFTGVSDHNWSNLDNWYDTDSLLSIVSLPTSSDNVNIVSWIDQNNGDPASVRTLSISGSGNSITIPFSVSNGATFSNGASFENGTLTGNVTFETGAFSNDATIIGDVSYLSNSYPSNTQITGAVIFLDSNLGGSTSITGTTTFNGSSTQYGGTITGNVFFNGSSSVYDDSVINGDATFNGDGSEFISGALTPTITGTKTRYYTTNTTTTRDFFTTGPWIVVADGASVNIVNAVYNEDTSFVELNEGSFTYPAPPVTTHTFSYSAGAHGSLTGSTTQVVTHNNDGTAVTAVPDSGYYFVDWSDSSTQNPRTDTNASGDITVTAHFAPITYTLSYISAAHGSLTGSTTQEVLEGQDGTTITAVPDSGYHFVAWSDASTSNPRTDTNVTGDISVSAFFDLSTTTPTVITSPASSISTTTATLNGTITTTGGANATIQGFNYGTTTSYTGTTTDSGSFGTGPYSLGIESLTCNTLYHFRAFATNSAGTATSTDTTFTTSACPGITTHTLTYTAGAHGTLTGSTTQVVETGDDGISVTAVPDSGYTFTAWSDASTSNPRTDTNVNGDVTVTATFTVIPAPTTNNSRSRGGSGGGYVPTQNTQTLTTTESIIDFLRKLFGSVTTITVHDVTPVNSNPTLSITPRDLKEDLRGADVTSLQSFLIKQDLGPEAKRLGLRGATGYFGALTKSALVEYQKINNITPSSGYFGPITRAFIQKKGQGWW